ncbi:MAG TPA: TerC family protein [Gemmatimonadales bacterium]|nr:TerC family protein [Gemmatimonadales bacterium]
MGHHGLLVWGGFTALVAILLIVDLGVLNRRSHVLSYKEALSWSGSIVALALLFGLFLLWREGHNHALEYYTGYIIELSLSVDNLFVFLLLFQYFRVPPELRARVLKWGILGAVVMRLLMILVGAYLIQRFHWILYLFGALLLYSAYRMLRQGEERALVVASNPVVRLAKRVMPFTDRYVGQRFFARTATGALVATPLLLVILVVEWSDLVFAIDSIPAVFAVTRDPFLVYSSNVFAILGLRALFFVIAGMMDQFVYLKTGVAVILGFVGVKMLTTHWVDLPIILSLGVIIGVLAISVLLSLWHNRREARANP